MPAEIIQGFPAALGDAKNTGLGLVTQSYDSQVTGATGSAVATQTIYALSVPVRAGQTVSTAWFNVNQAGTGTVPTSLTVGLCSPTTSLLVSGELKNDAAWGTIGFRSVSLGATYTFNYTGLAFVMFLSNGVFASTTLNLSRASSFGTTGPGTSFFYATAGTGQTALPAAAAAVTLSAAGTPLNFWAGLS